jgi:ketosteroid isomerase-like protein
MSQESMESSILALYDACNRRDWGTVREIASPDIVLQEASGTTPDRRICRGWGEVRDYLDGFFRFWEQASIEVREIAWADEALAVVSVRNTVIGRGSSVEVSTDSGTVIEFRDGILARATLYRTPEEAREAAGLGE